MKCSGFGRVWSRLRACLSGGCIRIFSVPPNTFLWVALLVFASWSVSYSLGGIVARNHPWHHVLGEVELLASKNRALVLENEALLGQIAELEYALDCLYVACESNSDAYRDALRSKAIPVTATIYQPVPEQCDDDPHITADGSVIDIRVPSSYNYLAVSRDLHARYGGPLSFGDKVYLANVGPLDGFYEVRDLMNARWTERVDILAGMGADLARYDRAVVIPVHN